MNFYQFLENKRHFRITTIHCNDKITSAQFLVLIHVDCSICKITGYHICINTWWDKKSWTLQQSTQTARHYLVLGKFLELGQYKVSQYSSGSLCALLQTKVLCFHISQSNTFQRQYQYDIATVKHSPAQWPKGTKKPNAWKQKYCGQLLRPVWPNG